MKILVVGAQGKTGRHVIAALRRRPESISLRGLSRRPFVEPAVESVIADLEVPADRARAVSGMDVVIHYGPAFDPRESAMGTGMIDAAQSEGVRRFIYISVLHPEIGDLVNHQAKLAVEGHLINSGIDWTVLRPQHYMQNIDVAAIVTVGRLRMPYPVDTVLGHVDMADVGEASAKVAVEAGHSFATYDLAADEHLSVTDICATVTRLAGRAVQADSMTASELIAAIQAHHPLTHYSIEGLHRLFSYYSRRGIWGNANVLSWLLGRPAGTFEGYVTRSLSEANLD